MFEALLYLGAIALPVLGAGVFVFSVGYRNPWPGYKSDTGGFLGMFHYFDFCHELGSRLGIRRGGRPRF